MSGASENGRAKVLVKEKIGDSGVALLREHFDVELGIDWEEGELERRIGDYDGILIRSATKMTAELIEKADAAAGDRPRRRRRRQRRRARPRRSAGSSSPTPRSPTSSPPPSTRWRCCSRSPATSRRRTRRLTEGKWDRSKYSGVELYEKTLGILGFGRIGQLVAHRARGFGMRVLAFDPFVSAERYRELGVEKAADPDEIYAQADFVTIHLPKTPETEGFLGAEAFQKMREGVRVLNVARGGLIDEAALKDALDSGKVAGAALDVFPSEPMTESPLFGLANVVVTPHLGASTAEATDRAGYQSAEQVVAALTGGVVSTAVNIPSIGAEDMQVLGPFLPLARKLGRLAMAIAEASSVERIEAAFLGRIAEFDTRLLTLAVIGGALEGRTEEQVNPVNAPAIAEERGSSSRRRRSQRPQDFNELIRVTVLAGDEHVAVAGTGIGPKHDPHLVEVQGRRLTIELEPYVTVFRYEDLPGMIGRVGTIFGEHGINISSAAIGHTPDGASHGEDGAGAQRLAAMVVTTDAAVPEEVVREIVASEGFVNGWSVDLG